MKKEEFAFERLSRDWNAGAGLDFETIFHRDGVNSFILSHDSTNSQRKLEYTTFTGIMVSDQDGSIIDHVPTFSLNLGSAEGESPQISVIAIDTEGCFWKVSYANNGKRIGEKTKVEILYNQDVELAVDRGYYNLSELPVRIDFERTVEGFEAQILAKDLSRPDLLRKRSRY